MSRICVKCKMEHTPYSSDNDGRPVCKACWDQANEDRVESAVRALEGHQPTFIKAGVRPVQILAWRANDAAMRAVPFDVRKVRRIPPNEEGVGVYYETVGFTHSALLGIDEETMNGKIVDAIKRMEDRLLEVFKDCVTIEHLGVSLIGASAREDHMMGLRILVYSYAAGVKADGTRVDNWEQE